MTVVEDTHLAVSHVAITLPDSRVLMEHPHAIMNLKGDALSCAGVVSGDVFVDVAQPALRFCRSGYLRHCRIR
jgi:hypothetical protein